MALMADGMQGVGNNNKSRSGIEEIASDGGFFTTKMTEQKPTAKRSPADQLLFDIASNKEKLMKEDSRGNSNLHNFAVRNSEADLIECIISTLTKGNNFKRDSCRQNYLGHTPLLISIIARNKTFTEMFLKAGVPFHHRDYLGKTIFHHLAEKDAAFFGNEIFSSVTLPTSETARVLKMADNEGVTAVHTAFQEGNEFAFWKFSQFGGVETLRQKDQKREYSLLHMAAERGDRSLVDYLLRTQELNMHVDQMGADEATPLHLAVSNGHLDVVSDLLDAGADATIPLRECSVLGLVPDECQTEMRALIARKVDGNIYNFLSASSEDYYGDLSDDDDEQ